MSQDEFLNELETLIIENQETNFKPKCIQKIQNFTLTGKEYKFDNAAYDPELLLNSQKFISPKADALMSKIRELDAADLKKHGKLFKHFIFSHLKSSSYGAKMVASVMTANGFNCGYSSSTITVKNKKGEENVKYGPLVFKNANTLDQTKHDNFYLLSSTTVYEQAISVSARKNILARFNDRDTNENGSQIRFMIMDSGFKEGIDLFDVKYVHIFEPSIFLAEQKQIIGRATRTCGQKGLEFHPVNGWPLDVFIYDLEIPQQLQGYFKGHRNMSSLILDSMNINYKLNTFQEELENVCIDYAVDHELTRNIHDFTTTGTMKGGSKHDTFQKMIMEKYGQFTWDPVKMENLCESSDDTTKIELNPTQKFIKSFFTPHCAQKGLILNHSVGTGKTCTAIATASSSFEDENYTIIWVTRTTLKNDLWKNVFDKSCHAQITEMINKEDFIMPSDDKKRMKLLSKSWKIRPMSYKQFSNLLLEKNSYYSSLVNINGKFDPLRKTLIIIDEVHKLFGGNDLSTLEKPDTSILHKKIMHSYSVSGSDSVKLLLMSATPIVENPLEMIELINLCKLPTEQLPTIYPKFEPMFLNDHGNFTTQGKQKFINHVTGLISYLNREKDARQFAQPNVLINYVPLVENMDLINKFDKIFHRDEILDNIANIEIRIQEENSKFTDELREANTHMFKHLHTKCESIDTKKMQKQCTRIVKRNIKLLIKEIKDEQKDIKANVKELKGKIKFSKQTKKDIMKQIKENITLDEDGLVLFKNTPYYQIQKKCGKKIKQMSDLKEKLKQHPDIVEYQRQISNFNMEIEDKRVHLERKLMKYKGLVLKIKLMLKEDFNQLEKAVLRDNVKMQQKSNKKLINVGKKTTRKEVSHIIKKRNITLKNIKTFTNEKKQYFKGIIKENKTKKTDLLKKERKLRTTMRKQSEYQEEFSNTFIKSRLDKYEQLINDEIAGIQ
jgi:hypothetical protein